MRNKMTRTNGRWTNNLPDMRMTKEDANGDEDGGTFGIITDKQGIADMINGENVMDRPDLDKVLNS